MLIYVVQFIAGSAVIILLYQLGLLPIWIIIPIILVVVFFIFRQFTVQSNQWKKFITSSGYEENSNIPSYIKTVLKELLGSGECRLSFREKEKHNNHSWIIEYSDPLTDSPSRTVMVFPLDGRTYPPIILIKHRPEEAPKIQEISFKYWQRFSKTLGGDTPEILEVLPKDQQAFLNAPNVFGLIRKGNLLQQVIPFKVFAVWREWFGRGLGTLMVYKNFCIVLDDSIEVVVDLSIDKEIERWSYHMKMKERMIESL